MLKSHEGLLNFIESDTGPGLKSARGVAQAQQELLDLGIRTAEQLSNHAIAAVVGPEMPSAPVATEALGSSDLTNAINFLLDDVIGLDRSSNLVAVVVSQGADKNGLITLDFNFALGAWPKSIIDELPSKIFGKTIDPVKLANDRTYAFRIQAEIKSEIESATSKIVDLVLGTKQGYEHAVATAASTAIKALLSSHFATTVSGIVSESLLTLDLPEKSRIADIFNTSFEEIGGDFFKVFVPEIAKTYAKLGLTQILTVATSGLNPSWATAISNVGQGVLSPVINTIVNNYFAEPGSDKPLLDGVNFAEVFGGAIAGLLVDFQALDKKIIDDILGLDGSGFIEEQIAGFLSNQLNQLVTDGFVDAVELLSGKIEIADILELFNQFAPQFTNLQIQDLFGDFFINYAGGQLAQLVVNIDSLPEALISQLGSYLAGEAIGSVIGEITLGAISQIFGSATLGAIGGTIFNGLTAILGAGIGTIAGSFVFELLDGLFDGAISGFFGNIIDWIRNDSPQAFYSLRFDAAQNEFVFSYEYSKDSNPSMRAAVKAVSDAFETKVEHVIDLVGQQASMGAGISTITSVWGKKHFDSKYATFLNGVEGAKLGFSSDPATVAYDTIGAVLRNMNFGSGNPVLAKAYEMWKAEIAASGNGSNASFATQNAMVSLQKIIGLAHFANGYRQDQPTYDTLIASDSAMGVTILQQVLEARSRGFLDATTLRGSHLREETIGSADAGDTIILDGPANHAIARGGDDSVFGNAAANTISGGTGSDTLYGNGGGDTIDGDEGADKIYGGEGDDLLRGGSGDDFMLGDQGNDRLKGGGGKDTLFGWTGDDVLLGGDGQDLLSGEDGGDVLDGGSDADDMHGGSGDDTYFVDNAGDTVTEVAGEGIDRLLTNVSYYLGTAAEIEFLSAADPASVDLIDLRGNNGTQVITGNNGANVIEGLGGNDSLYGLGGNDILDGGTGIDLLDGGDGDDRFIVSASGIGSSVVGGSGLDTLAASGALTLGALDGIERVKLADGSNLTLTGAQFATGLAADSTLSGSGTFTVAITAGTAFVASGMTIAAGSNIAFTITGSTGDDSIKTNVNTVNTVNAGAGNDQIRGGLLADTINGGADNDKITGYGGADILTGGAGADQFRYLFSSDSATGANADRITDFLAGTDRLNFALLDADPLAAGRQALSYIGVGSFSATGVAQVRHGTSGANMLVLVDLDGDGTADMEIVLAGASGQTLTSGDFML
jgi:Ca2+-binding RTX toxin-like protein